MTTADGQEMTFLEHLEEMRRMIIDTLVALLIALIGAWFVSGHAVDLLVRHTMPPEVPVVFLSPFEAFAARFNVALSLAVLVALPYMAWRVWRFVVPGLLASERRIVVPLALGSTGLFYLGSFFAYAMLVPVVIRVLLAFGTGNLVPTIAVGSLLGFLLKLCLAGGLVFQLPLVVAALTYVGVVTPERLLSYWRYAVLIIFIVAALVTPVDGASQLLFALPVSALYFLSIGLSRLIRRRAPAEPEVSPTPPGEESR